MSLTAILTVPAHAAEGETAPAVRLREVTVTATSDTLEEQRAAVTQKTVLDRAEIESLGGLTVGEVIHIDSIQRLRAVLSPEQYARLAGIAQPQ